MRLTRIASWLICALLAAGAARAAEAVKASVFTAQGYGRVLFTWEKPVKFEADVKDGVVVVSFARPLSVALDSLRHEFGEYTSLIKQDGDGRTLRFVLVRDVRLHTSAQDSRIAIDFVPASYPGTPPDLPPLPPPPAPEAAVSDPAQLPVLKVRAGEHPDRTRIVFEYAEKVETSVVAGDGKLTIFFSKPMKADLSAITARLPAFVRGASWKIENEMLRVDFTIDPASTFAESREGAKVVFDIFAPKPDAVAAGAPPVPVPPEPAKAPPAGSDGAAVVSPKPETAKPTPLTLLSAAAAVEGKVPASDAEAGDVEAAASPAAKPFTLEARSVKGGFELAFTLDAESGAAAYKRGQELWIVFDRPGAFDLSQADRRFFPMLAAIAQIANPEASVIRVTLGTPALASLAEKGATWTVTLAESLAAAALPITLTTVPLTVGPAEVSADLPGATRIVWLDDPDAGDRIGIVTAHAPARGVVATRRYVEFSVLASAHGLIVQPLADDLEVALSASDVRITTPRGLTLAAGTVALAPDAPKPAEDAPPGFMDFEKWRGSFESFNAEKQRLLAEASPAGADLRAVRLDTARFYIANKLAPEALGVLRLLAQTDEEAASLAEFHALRGVALLMAARWEEARADLTASTLSGDANAALWRTWLFVRLGDYAQARREFTAGQGELHRYPPEWAARFRLSAAEAALAVNDLQDANDQLTHLPDDGVPRALKLEALYLQGRVLERLERTADALGNYRTVAEAGYKPLAVKAAFAEIDLQNRMGSLSNKEAIERLEKLRFQWRGDETELAILRRLGQLYVAEGDVRNGLSIMRTAAANFSESAVARDITDEMGAIFERLYLSGEAGRMEPVQALGLYYDYKELTPIGRMGDEMIRKLADRLIEVDLLGQAAELLQHQVDERLEGVARAAVATRLAVVYLLDRKPEKALDAIRATRQTLLPGDLARERRLLEARALSELKQYDAALDLIAVDEGGDALRLRADIYWAARNWAAAAAKLEALLGERWKSDAPLTSTEAGDVLRAGVAFSLAEDAEGLARLRAEFGALMAKTDQAAPFEVVSAPIETQGVDFRELARSIAASDSFEAFIKPFRERYAPGRQASAAD